MTANEMTAVIGAFGVSIIGPIVGYVASAGKTKADTEKLQADRAATATKRDTDHLLLKQEVESLKAKLCELDDLRNIMHDVKTSVAKIEAILPLLTKLLEERRA